MNFQTKLGSRGFYEFPNKIRIQRNFSIFTRITELQFSREYGFPNFETKLGSKGFYEFPNKIRIQRNFSIFIEIYTQRDVRNFGRE